MSLLDKLQALNTGDIVTGKIGRHGEGYPDWKSKTGSVTVYVQRDRNNNIVLITPTEVEGKPIDWAEFDPRIQMAEYNNGDLWFDAEDYIFLIEDI